MKDTQESKGNLRSLSTATPLDCQRIQPAEGMQLMLQPSLTFRKCDVGKLEILRTKNSPPRYIP
eukprot:scaffold4492_cov107-Cylindrotheca_fusiformis.AAC.1